jgi:hypothetical protein
MEKAGMAEVQKRVVRKTGKTVATLAQAIAAYDGRRRFCEAFCISDDQLDAWQRWGDIPRGAQLGLLLGLKARGFDSAPTLFGVDSWADVAGELPTGTYLAISVCKATGSRFSSRSMRMKDSGVGCTAAVVGSRKTRTNRALMIRIF